MKLRGRISMAREERRTGAAGSRGRRPWRLRGVGRDVRTPSLPTSRSDPFGFCRVAAFGNSLADSVSFRFPSR